MRLLVTGAAGFIGSRLSARALNEGATVVGVDSFDAYYSTSLKHERVRALLENPHFSMLTRDISSLSTWREIDTLGAFDAFVHLAAQVGVRLSQDDEEKYVTANLVGFQHACAWATKHSQTRFVYASSSNVYGNNSKLPFSETDVVDNPITFYGATKRANELMATAAFARYGRTSTGIRFFTVYGPWGRPDMAVYRFAERIVRGEEIVLFGNGELSRDYTFVDDAIEALWRVLRSKEASATVVNIGTRRPEKTIAVVSLLEKHLGRSAFIRLDPASPGEMQATWADTAELKRRVGFEPQTSLADGTRAFVDWFAKRTR